MSDNDELRGALVDLFERHGFHWSETEIKAVLDASAALGDAWSWKMAADEAEKEVKALRAALDEAEAERDAAIAAARIAHDALWELSPNNYDHDEVCKVNDGSVEAILTLAPIIGETHGKPPEWWAERAAHLGDKP